MTDAAVLTVNGADVTGPTEWSMTWEERTDGSPGQFSAVVQNRSPSDYTFGLARRDHVNLALGGSGFQLYDGEIVNSKLDLPVGHIGRWNLGGSDWNTIPDLRLVGVPTGETWVTYDGGLTVQNVDPFAQSGGTDAGTVAYLFDHYVRRPSDGGAFDTSTYVGTYVPDGILGGNGRSTGLTRRSVPHWTTCGAWAASRSSCGSTLRATSTGKSSRTW